MKYVLNKVNKKKNRIMEQNEHLTIDNWPIFIFNQIMKIR